MLKWTYILIYMGFKHVVWINLGLCIHIPFFDIHDVVEGSKQNSKRSQATPETYISLISYQEHVIVPRLR